MFLRFSKGEFNSQKVREYRKCVFLNGSVVMEFGDNIVGVAKLHEETDKYVDYDVIVADQCISDVWTIESTQAEYIQCAEWDNYLRDHDAETTIRLTK